MTPTTPPRPLDVLALFPDLAGHAATATRLHPRPGAPTTADSSIGGPLLWPAGEPWPVCEDGDHHYVHKLSRPASVRRAREIMTGAQARAAATGAAYGLTDDERAELAGDETPGLKPLLDQPIPLLPVAQLYRRDVPDFTGPGDSDLIQVLWCPLDHPEEGHNPRPRVHWRRAADVTRPLASVPEPPMVADRYLPRACVVHPEQIVEYPYADLLPDDLNDRITAWEEENEDKEDEEHSIDYQFDLSLAPGFKVGGFANWSLTDPHPMNCADCGTAMTLLFTAASYERNGPACSWAPSGETVVGPVGITIGRGYDLYLFRCPASFDHPTATAMQ
jgi:hypothetical protein